MNIAKLSLYIVKNNIDISSLEDVLNKYNLNFTLPAIYKYISKYNLNQIEINRSRILSPYKISETNISEIEKKYNLKIDESILEKNIIGGYKLYTKDKIYDNSLNNIISKLKK